MFKTLQAFVHFTELCIKQRGVFRELLYLLHGRLSHSARMKYSCNINISYHKNGRLLINSIAFENLFFDNARAEMNVR